MDPRQRTEAPSTLFKRWSRRGALIGAARYGGLTLGLGLAACSSPAPAPTASKAPEKTTSAPATGKTGKPTLIVAIDNDIDNMDTYAFVSDASYALRMNAHTRLLEYPTEPGPNGTIVQKGRTPIGLAAESFEPSSDFKKWQFKLRPNVKTSTGAPITADDVKYSYERSLALPGSPATYNRIMTLSKPEQLVVKDQSSFEINVERATPLFPNLHAINHKGIVLSKQVMQQHATPDDPWTANWGKNNAVGAGPYALEKWTPGSEFRLVPNQHYFKPEAVANNGVIVKFLPNGQDRLLLLKRGDVDLAMGFPPKDIVELEKDQNLIVHALPTVSTNYLGMNNAIAPFDNPKVRQAISYAIPYQTIIEKALYNYADRLYGPMPSTMAGFDKNVWTQGGYETDVEKAKALLREAGHPNGFKTDLAVLAGKTDWIDAAVWIQSSLKNIGIDVNLTPMADAQFFDKFNKKEHPFFIHYFRSWLGDGGLHLYLMFHSTGINPVKYNNPQADQLLESIMYETDATKRQSLVTQAQQLVLKDAPWGFLFSQKHIIATRKNVSGLAVFDDLMFRFEYLTKN